MRYYSKPAKRDHHLINKPFLAQRNDVRLIVKNPSKTDIYTFEHSYIVVDVFPCHLAAGQSMQLSSACYRNFMSCRANESFVLDVYRLMDNGEELPCSWDGTIDDYVNKAGFTGLANQSTIGSGWYQEVALFDSTDIGDNAVFYCELGRGFEESTGTLVKLNFDSGYFELSQDMDTKKATVSLYNNVTKSYAWQQEFDALSKYSRLLVGRTGCIINGVYYKKTAPKDFHITGTVRLEAMYGFNEIYFGQGIVSLNSFDGYKNSAVDRQYYSSKQDVTTESNGYLCGSVSANVDAFEAGLLSYGNVAFKHNYHYNELKWVASKTTKRVIWTDPYYGSWPNSAFLTDIIMIAPATSNFVPKLRLDNSNGNTYDTITADKTYSNVVCKVYVFSNIVLGLVGYDEETMSDIGINSVTITPESAVTASFKVYTNIRRL